MLHRRLRMSPIYKLVVLAVLSELAYLLIALTGQSLHQEGVGDWSLLTILGLFTAAFAAYLLAIRYALAAKQDRRLLKTIGLFAVLFRLTLLFTDPIAEIDIYRYLWDGEAASHGVDPFRYSPAQIVAVARQGRSTSDFAIPVGSHTAATVPASPTDSIPPDLAKLVELYQKSPEMTEIVGRIHFAELPTIYPPTSQVVFAIASLCTPDGASVLHRMVIFKTWFVMFDLMTLVLVVMLLRDTGRPIGWSLAYGWCPLLVKEFANSGHLDAVAVFFMTLAVWLTVRACFVPSSLHSDRANDSKSKRLMLIAMLTLGVAIGAKLYPVVLVPLFLLACWKRFGVRRAMVMGLLLSVATSLIMFPMVPREKPTELTSFRFPSTAEELPPVPPPFIGTEARDPSESLRAFLSEWEMNDFVFLLGMENIRPTDELRKEDVAWFSVVPEVWRAPVRAFTGRMTGVEASRTPFFFTRAVTSVALLALAIGLAWRAVKRNTPAAFLEAAFLTVAWFWLILPTGNPWYWTWALPLLPFARGKAWLALSGLVLLYYARFWLTFHYPDTPVLGTTYQGSLFFDFIVTWIEFGPWFVVLAFAHLRSSVKKGSGLFIVKCGGK